MLGTLGQTIRTARLAMNWSQMDLARRIGVSQPMVSYWERDVGIPNDEIRSKLESVLGHLDKTAVVAEEDLAESPDSVEGMEPIGQSGFEEYPIDSLMIRTEHRTVHDLLRRIEKNQMVLTPDFQRDFVWDELKQSRLIESVLMRIPLPVMYLAEDKLGRLIVVDGLQRLSTLWRFVKNDLALRIEHASLKGKRFNDLDARLQNRVEDTPLTLYIIDAKVDDRIRLDIFERVNSGEPLTRQQMRNCIYNGPGTRWLAERAASPLFTRLFSPALRDAFAKAMRDREIINRFAAFHILGADSYRGDMDQFVGDALKQLNTMSDNERNALTKDFERGLENNWELFSEKSFRRHEEGSNRSTRFNIALFDVLCTFLGRYDTDLVKARRAALLAAFYGLMRDEAFWNAIAYGTNQRDRVKSRFDRIPRAFREVLGD